MQTVRYERKCGRKNVNQAISIEIEFLTVQIWREKVRPKKASALEVIELCDKVIWRAFVMYAAQDATNNVRVYRK